MSSVKVSVITPSYNQAEYLEETIRSVLDQTYPDIEYIIIDGGSTDASVDIIRKYENRLKYWVSEPDAGQADAINKGFALASGEYLCWLNSDDVLFPDAISTVIGFLREHPEVGFAYGDILHGFTPETGLPWRGRAITHADMLTTFEIPVPQQGSIWKRSVLETVGTLNPQWQVVLDREFFLRIAESCVMAYVPVTLGFFRQHPKSKSVALQTRWLRELPVMYEEYFGRHDLPEAIFSLRGRALAMMNIQCCVLALKTSQYSQSLSFLWRAFASDPSFPFGKGAYVMLHRYISRFRKSL